MTTALDVLAKLHQSEAEILANYIASLFLKPVKEGWSVYPYSSITVSINSEEENEVVLELKMKGFIVNRIGPSRYSIEVYPDEVIEDGAGCLIVKEVSLQSITSGLETV